LELLNKTHQEQFGLGGSPVVGEMRFSLGSRIIVGGLKRAEQLGQLGMNISGENRHDNENRDLEPDLVKEMAGGGSVATALSGVAEGKS
jgi:hypothetical protein